MDLSAFNLQGKVALITGGAHGIGFSIAEGMAKCGAVICFNCSSEASLEKGMAAYKAAGIDAHGYVADVSDEDAVNAMVAKIKSEVGSVDILVNNAGKFTAVLWFTGFYCCLWLALGGAALFWLAFWYSLFNVGYVLVQDYYTFPRIFTDYAQYKRQVPFLLPNVKSLKNCILTLRKVGD